MFVWGVYTVHVCGIFIYGAYIGVCKCICLHMHVQKHKDDMDITFHLIPLRQILPLNLELGLQPASPMIPCHCSLLG